MLIYIDDDQEFILKTDLSNCALKGILSEYSDKFDKSIVYVSKRFKEAETRDSTTKKEPLIIIYHCEIF
jgi:hypothetical protein